MTTRTFKRLMIHRCRLIMPGIVTGTDEYGRDIVEDLVREDVPCKADQIRTAVSPGTTGTDYIYTNVLFISADNILTPDARIEDIKDKYGNFILQGSYKPDNIVPIYKGDKPHHYEIALIKE